MSTVRPASGAEPSRQPAIIGSCSAVELDARRSALHGSQLAVAAGFGGDGARSSSAVAERGPALAVGPVRVGVGPDRLRTWTENPLHDTDLVLGARCPRRASATKSRARIVASLVISQTADHTRVRGSDSAMSPIRSMAVASESASSASLQ